MVATVRRANGSAAGARSTTSGSSSSSFQSIPLQQVQPAAAKAPFSSPDASMPFTPSPTPTHSPFLPTRLERLLLAVYPATLFLGSLFSHLSPTVRPPWNRSVYSPEHQSFQPPGSAPSYFARKRNVFNVYFVKVGWFWCTLAFFLFLLFVARGRPSPPLGATQSRERGEDERKRHWTDERAERDSRLRRRYQAVLRYLVSTVFWIFTTQWFFGPPLVDRGFALTGGACDLAEERLEDPSAELATKFASFATHAACSAAGGRWRGGYDISGHVFLLVLGSGMLWMEMLPYLLPTVKGLGIGRVVRSNSGDMARVGGTEAGAVRGDETTGSEASPSLTRQASNASPQRTYATSLALGVVALSWWMLLMTAAFFHTWLEKATGLLLAMAVLYVIYFLPRGLPAIRRALGMPGV